MKRPNTPSYRDNFWTGMRTLRRPRVLAAVVGMLAIGLAISSSQPAPLSDAIRAALGPLVAMYVNIESARERRRPTSKTDDPRR